MKPPVPQHFRAPMHPGLTDRVRQLGVGMAQQLAAYRLFGWQQTRGVVVCGFPRSGSTLLLLMLETAYPGSRHYGRERAALRLARYEWPGRHPLMISKRPNDVMWIDEIRSAYRHRGRKPCFIVTTRDPRAILTSRHAGREGYYVSVERWRTLFAHIEYVRQFPDVTTVEYRQLVERPAEVQNALVGAIGEPPASSFDAFGTNVPPEFNTRALNGVRPLDASALDKWRRPEHRERIQLLLDTMPELPTILISEGYEPDAAWTDPYR